MTMHVCPQCQSEYTSVMAMIYCCDEAAYGDDD